MPAKRSRLPKGLYWRENVIWFRIKLHGRQHRESLRTADVDLAQKAAERLRARLIAEAHGGEHRRSWADSVMAWNEHHAPQIAATTYRRYLCSLRQALPLLRTMMVDDITDDTMAAFVKFRRHASASTATIRRDLTAISSVLGYATDEGWRKGNPALDRMKRLRERRDPIALPELPDIETVVARSPGLLSALVRFAFETGMRQEEVASLEWRAVKGDELTVVGKGSKRRTIELRPEARAILDRLPRQLRSRFVFWHGDGSRFANVASRFAGIVAGAQKVSQLEGRSFRPFRFHDLRHRFAVDRLKEGWSLYEVQRYLGHSSVKVTEIYLAHLTAEQEVVARCGAQKVSHDRAVRDVTPSGK